MSQLFNFGNCTSNISSNHKNGIRGNINTNINSNSNMKTILQQYSPVDYNQCKVSLPDFSEKNNIGVYYNTNDNNYNNTNNNFVTSPNMYPRYISQHKSIQNTHSYQYINQSNDNYNKQVRYEPIPNRINVIDEPSEIIDNGYSSKVNYLPSGFVTRTEVGAGAGKLSCDNNISSNGLDLNSTIKTEAGGYDNTKSNLSKLNSSNWKEWSSYSKLLPLAVIELDVQNECNYLSTLFSSFSNTVKGFISNFEFEKLMEYVNIIEVGYRGTIFGVMDRNQDDYITQVEFLTGMLIFRPYNAKEKNSPNFNRLRLQFIFFYYDSNRDGLLSIDELAKLIEHISIIKVTVNNKNGKPKKKTQISTEKSKKLASQVIHDYLNKDFCSYDDFFQLVNNGILNGTVNLLRCRNDIFLQKKNNSLLSPNNQHLYSRPPITNSMQNFTNLNHQQPFSPFSNSITQFQNQFSQVSQISPYNTNNHPPQNFIAKNSSIYNTPINISTEHFPNPKTINNINDEYLRTILSKPHSPSTLNTNNHPVPTLSIPNPKTNALPVIQKQNIDEKFGYNYNNTNNNNNNINNTTNNNTITPPHNSFLSKNNSISSTITRKQEEQFTAQSSSPPNQLVTPDPLSNYRSIYESSSPYYNIPSEGHPNFNFSPC
ncbi:erythrocyte membrane-associated antigen [Cryptosporidium ubiquitum]|uniref:Erythrocyte membrane-associated antigen n=1 Tax=Cryptosporidium ubiquitum TaxID=857276 RepID=A0A1J4MMT4_9CRYT|nr:erythrocyte membrane-associated antigen [Cryptosporidium ubiquitum]OII74763.1 erythrocyte membrane-associated antigen [Cryptosporidium ubiquitum]